MGTDPTQKIIPGAKTVAPQEAGQEKQVPTEKVTGTGPEQAEFFRILIDHISTPIALVNTDGIVQLASASWASLFGLFTESCRGLSLYDLLPEASRKNRNRIQLVVENGMPQQTQDRFTLAQGKFWYQCEFQPVKTDGQPVSAVLVQLVEINQWKVAEEKLTRTMQELENTRKAMVKAQVAKSHFLANITQEIRTPLNSIIGFSQVMLRDIATKIVNPEVDFQYLVENIEKSGHHLSEIINSILDLSQLETGEMTYNETDIDLSRTLKNVFYLNKIEALEKNLDFSYVIDPQIPQFARSDRNRLEQILNILLQNAIRYTPEGKKVCLGIALEDEKLVFSVADEGIGIPPKIQARLFDPFQYHNDSSSQQGEHVGLGLLIAKKMVEMLFGTITFESQTDKGTTFTVKIPYIQSNKKEDRHQKTREKITFAKDNVVLVVEDNLITQELIGSIFSHFGLTVHLANNGQEGVELAARLKPDLIMMDIFMPVMNGLEATSFIRTQPEIKDTPIVALTAGALQDQRSRAKAAGVNDYLTKPIAINTLIPILTRFLRTEKTIVYDVDGTETDKQQQNLQTVKLQKDRALQEKQVDDRTQELIRAKDLAELASQSKTRFLANMSHDIRNPLNAIIGFSRILKKKAVKQSLSAEFTEYLDNIIQSGHNLTELVNNILDISKIEAGKMEIVKEVIHLRQLVNGIYTFNRAQADAKDLKLVCEFDLDPEIKILSDHTCLNQILMNLTANAIKFTPRDKTITIRVTRTADLLVFQIIDQGIGIPKEFQDIIFNSFEQLSDNNQYPLRGTGLGLAIVKNRVDLLGGTIDVDSEVGKRSVFTVKIPLEEVVDQPDEDRPVDLGQQFSPDNRILVVEDDPTNLMMIQALFEDMNLKIEIAENGKQGLEKVSAIQPHLVMLDMNMPVMSGLETILNIRSKPEPLNRTPIIVFSGDAFKEQQKEAFEAGADEYLTKPIDEGKLVSLLRKYLSSTVST
ncbi:MAG: ATP-binding protein [bacterium]